MKKLTTIVFALVLVLGFMVSVGQARNSMLEDVNTVCGTSYSCGLCHVDPKGGGPLTATGTEYAAAGYDACAICPTSSTCTGGCTDVDGDGYFAESGCGTGVDCNDADLAINPGATELCSGGIDENCNGKIDCADAFCTTTAGCVSTAEVCNDGIDNDGDRKVDCKDTRDCRKDPACVRR